MLYCPSCLHEPTDSELETADDEGCCPMCLSELVPTTDEDDGPTEAEQDEILAEMAFDRLADNAMARDLTFPEFAEWLAEEAPAVWHRAELNKAYDAGYERGYDVGHWTAIETIAEGEGEAEEEPGGLVIFQTLVAAEDELRAAGASRHQLYRLRRNFFRGVTNLGLAGPGVQATWSTEKKVAVILDWLDRETAKLGERIRNRVAPVFEREVERALETMADAGTIERAGGGWYRIPLGGLAAA